MEPLIVTAHLTRAFVAFDAWSPALDALLQAAILDERGMRSSNPSPEDVEATQPLLDAETPLGRITLAGMDLWACSAPHYHLAAQQTTTYYKRWSGHDSGLAWGKAKPKWNESAGLHKNYNLPNFGRVAPAVHWFVRGDGPAIARLLATIPAIGKKTSQGNGQVARWEVAPMDDDCSLVAGDRLAKIVPVAAAAELPKNAMVGCAIARRTVMPPYWMAANAVQCLLPCANIFGDQ